MTQTALFLNDAPPVRTAAERVRVGVGFIDANNPGQGRAAGSRAKGAGKAGKAGKTAKRGSELPGAYAPPGSVPINRWISAQPRQDLGEFMRLYGFVGAADFGRRCSEKTHTNRRVVLWSTFVELQKRVRGLSTLSQFTPRYIPLILEIWGEKSEAGLMRLSYDTQVQNFSVLSWFWKVHGIAVQPIKSYIDNPQERLKFQRSSVATADKSWSGNGIDYDDVVRRAREIDPVVARLLSMARNFGMRANETLRMRPHEADKGDHLSLTEGTKTGRPRDIDYDTFGKDNLVQAIEAVKSELSPGQHAAWQGRSLVQARRRLYHVLERLGVTKAELGVTMHGLRSQWAIEQFERLTGATAPIRGGTAVDYRRFSEDRKAIAEAMGHGRIRVTAAYFGSFFAMKTPAEKRFKESWALLTKHLHTIKECLASHGIDNLWWVGARANGANVNLGDIWEFLCDDTVPAKKARAAARDLARAIEHEIGIVYLHSSLSAPAAAKKRWADNALPLFDVEAPQMQCADSHSGAAPHAQNTSADTGAERNLFRSEDE